MAIARIYPNKVKRIGCMHKRQVAAFFLLFGFVMTAIGIFLNVTQRTNFFVVEMLALPWFIAPMFGCIETKLSKFDLEHRGEKK